MITFGRYRIVHRIASGGMAEVYRAIAVGEGGFEKEVVLKRIRPELAGDPRFGAMFVEEARVAATLSHANIVQVLDFGRVDGEYFLTLESVRGRDLRQVLDTLAAAGTLLPLDLALLVAVDVARALDYAHRRKGADGHPLGLVHRDISPANVLLSFEGEVKLADFGIAKVLGDDCQTEAGALKGKVAYMSPEQASGMPVDQRSDIFSFGVLLHVLFTGEHPFAGGGALEILERVRRAEIAPPRRAGEPLPEDVLAIVTRCLARRPEDRFASAADLLRALEAFAGGHPARATATDLSVFMKGRFPYEVPLPIVALDRLVEQELRLEATDEGLATFTAVAAAPSPAADSPAAVAASPSTDRAAAREPGAEPSTGARRGRTVAAVVLLLALVGGSVALWRWLPPAATENGNGRDPRLAAGPSPAPASAPTGAPASARTTMPAPVPASVPAALAA
ncbi:MAG: protein kinase, partial [Deltaproteobacteria bacterium]|nr:protein kinase [Deltaproteobacteria bacterium]